MPVEPKTVILMYHRVASVELDPWGMCVSPVHFAGQLRAIQDVAAPISLRDYVRFRDEGALPGKTVVVTFDDGYLDNLECALPLLRQHAVPATVFVSTSNVDSEREFWWDRLETLLLQEGTLPDRFELPLSSGHRQWDLGPAARYTAAQVAQDASIKPWTAARETRLGFFYDVWKSLRPQAASERDAMLDRIASWAGVAAGASASRRTMSSAELRMLADDALMEIGAHTVDHSLLGSSSEALQSEQILHSRDSLQQILGRPVRSFAYPHGDYSEGTVRILKEFNFECAVTGKQFPAGRQTDAMQLPRFGVKDVDFEAFRTQLQEWFSLPVAG